MSKKNAKHAASTKSTPAPAKAEKQEKTYTPATPARFAPDVLDNVKEAAQPAPATIPESHAPAQATAEATPEGTAEAEKAAKTALLDSHPAELERAEVEKLSGYHWTDDEFAFVAKWWKSHDKETLKGALKVWKSAFLGDARERGDAIRTAKEITPEQRQENLKRFLARNGNVNVLLRHAYSEAEISGETFYFNRYVSEKGAYIEWEVSLVKDGSEPEHLFDVFFGERAQKICFDEAEDVEPSEDGDTKDAPEKSETAAA